MVTEGVVAAQGNHHLCMLLTLELTLLHPIHMSQGYVPYICMKCIQTLLTVGKNCFFVQQNLCLYSSENVGVMSTGMVQIESGAEDHLQMAVALAGPVTVSIDSRHSAFQVRRSFKISLLSFFQHCFTLFWLLNSYW